MKRKGFSLLEIIFSVGLLMVLFFAVFQLFEMGTYHFHVGMLRHSAQHDVRRAWMNLERDLRQTVAVGVAVDNSAGRNVTVSVKGSVISVPRAIVALPGMSNWLPDAPTFDPTTGLPNWDRQILYQATLDQPDGQLFRIELDPGAPFEGGVFPGFSTAVTALSAGPPPMGALIGGAKVSNIKKISTSVFSFEVIPVAAVVQVILRVRGKTRAEAGQGEREETFEVNLKITPNNDIQG